MALGDRETTVISADAELRFNSDDWQPYEFTLLDRNGTFLRATFYDDNFDCQLDITEAVRNKAAFLDRLHAEHDAIREERKVRGSDWKTFSER